MKRDRVLLFATRAYLYLRDAIAAAGGFTTGDVEVREFPDGERYQRLVHGPSGCDAVLVGGTISDRDTLELYDLAGTLARAGARSLTLVVPYFGYSTMERATRPGEVVTAKSRACLLSSLPPAAFGNRVILVDLHSEGIPYFFEGALQPTHLYAKPVVLEVARRLGGDDFVLACTDAGRAKWVESLANDLGVPASFVFKRRLSGSEVEISAVSAQVEGRRVIIYDDMIRTGGSLLKAAAAYRAAGATSIAAIATHGLFPGDSLTRLADAGLFTGVVVTDTHPRAVAARSSFVEVVSLAPLIAHHLQEQP